MSRRIGIGIGIENNGIGIGIELKKWNWPQPCMQPPKKSTVYWLTTQLIWFTLLRIILMWIMPSYTDICFNNASLILSNESNSYVLKHEACINSQRHVRMCFGKSKTFTILQRIFSSNVQSDKMLLRNKVRCCYYHLRLSEICNHFDVIFLLNEFDNNFLLTFAKLRTYIFQSIHHQNITVMYIQK